MNADYHPYTWLVWLASGASLAILARNPLYLSLTLLAAGFIYAVLLRRQPAGGITTASQARPGAWNAVIKLAVALWVFTILFNMLTVHVGQHILFTLPRSWPMIGGPLTLEAVLYGFVTGLGFVTLILVFTVFNSAVGPQTLLRMIPAFAHHAGVALTIAVSFIPQTVIAWQEVREAQRLRGYRVRGLRDLQPLFISLLGIGLDRAIQLAESMEARGFGSNITPLTGPEKWLVRAGTVVGLLLLLAGLLARSFVTQSQGVGLGLMAGGALLLAFAFRKQGQRLQRTRYRRWLWRRRDTIVSLISGLLLLITLALAFFAPEHLFYYPYPPYDLIPSFNPFLGFLSILLITPALLLPPLPARTSSHTLTQVASPTP